ncbi:MAG: ABC transporter permease [Candidatus Omnitrophica bacterium]|nr:ABC transporter permease [Candidatus Omnitrophota bacterium]
MKFRKRIKNVFFHKSILWEMSIKQLKAKYSGSMLGIWWAVATPLILAVSINFIFTNVFKVGIENFTFFVLSGIVPWLLFSNAINEAAGSFIANFSVLRQAIFPREFVPMTSIISNFLIFLIGLLILLPFFIVSNPRVITVLPFLLVVLFFYLFFLVGLAMIFSSLNVFFRDVSHLLAIGLMVWFWVTPIFYSLDMLPASFRWICLSNPVTYYVVSYRLILFEAKPLSLPILLTLFFISFTSFIVGYAFFLKNENSLLKRV